MNYREHLSVLIKVMATLLIDAAFVLLWALLQWGLEAGLSRIPLAGNLGKITIETFQYAFAVTTAVPVLLWLLKDLVIVARGIWLGLTKSWKAAT